MGRRGIVVWVLCGLLAGCSASTFGLSGGHPALASCGDEFVDPGEECDDGNQDDADGCTNVCTLARCGDGIVGPGDECDDGNADESDDCRSDCTLPVCGDGLAQGAEPCDDGNLAGGDACSSSCRSTVIREIAIGGETTCLLFEEGTVRCWGEGVDGQLGQGSTEDLGDAVGELPVPDVVVGGTVVGLDVGRGHVCARVEGDTLRCWGHNDRGQLWAANTSGAFMAIGDEPGEMPPAQGRVTDALQVVSGAAHTCALRADHTVVCWGANEVGQLGVGNTIDVGGDPADELVPVQGVEDVKALAAGDSFTCALIGDGSVECWGANSQGQLGVGSTNSIGDDMSDVIRAANVGRAAVQVAAGDRFMCVRLDDGSVRCWGQNDLGQSGREDSVQIGDDPGELPKNVNLGAPAEQLVVGTNHACVLIAGEVRCWGFAKDGRLGYGDALENIGDDPGEMPPPALEIGGPAVKLSAHLSIHTCVEVEEDDATVLRCWGGNLRGPLGRGDSVTIGDNEMPAPGGAVPY